MDNFLTLDNLLQVVQIIKPYYAEFNIFVTFDKFGVKLLKFMHKTQNLDYEIVLVNNFDVKLNKRYCQKANVRAFKRIFREAMSAVCGQEYVDALQNYVRYDKTLKIYL